MQARLGIVKTAILALCWGALAACSSKGDDTNSGAAGNNSTAGTASGGSTASVALELHSYTPDDPKLQYMGRIDWSDPTAPRFASTAVQLKAKFVGTGATIKILDENRYGNYKNYFEVMVDDAPAVKLTALKSQTDYVVAQDLPNGEHTLVVAKRTEAGIGFARFLGLDVVGELVEPPARPTRRIEIIGDSISCGSGDEAMNGSPQCMEDGWGQPYHNGYLAYGPVMARSLDAEYNVTAVSGIGLVRNYSNMYDPRPLPEVYDLMYYEEMTSEAWDTSQFVPDAIVIALGTNDFSPGDSERDKMDVETYTAAYVAFVDKLRGYYPDAHIFGMSSPMLGDGWPNATDTSATDLKTALAAMVEHFASAGDPNVHQINVSKVIGTGCGTHPGVAQHASMAAEVATAIKNTLGW
ncbi:MAG: SGNH/GDSL hydrolase family protein [Myxococcales bacterium]